MSSVGNVLRGLGGVHDRGRRQPAPGVPPAAEDPRPVQRDPVRVLHARVGHGHVQVSAEIIDANNLNLEVVKNLIYFV